ncbi:MAG: cardiolipin synthase [Flavobacteriaceae bacterium]
MIWPIRIDIDPTTIFPVLVALYYVVIVAVCIKIIIDTTNTTKALAYLFLVVFLPFVGMALYFSIGINYRKRRMFKKKLGSDTMDHGTLETRIRAFSGDILKKHRHSFAHYHQLASIIFPSAGIITANNHVRLLKNGETKYPEVLETLQHAQHHIHMEYYIYENDTIGNEIANVLMEKAKAGIAVRFIYDDFGSKNIRKNLVKRLRESGVETAPFYKIKLVALANRLNYRNHRKIIVVDGTIGFVGGINVSDKYINARPYNTGNHLFWRDTHLRIEGQAVVNLQHIFLTDWNFCARDTLKLSKMYFPTLTTKDAYGNQLVQISVSGPDSTYPNIMYALIQAILLSKKEILITTPYFIPEKSYTDALMIAALSGVSVKIMVPGISDSVLVNAAANSYYEGLLDAGVKIYKYQKGFVHAKTMVCDGLVSFVGTANLDNRSFDLNFEVNAIVYDAELASQLRQDFLEDVGDALEIMVEDWKNRPYTTQILERTARLLSPLL